MNIQDKLFLEGLLELVNSVQSKENNIDINEKLKDIDLLYKSIENIDNTYQILDEMLGDIPQTFNILLEYIFQATHDEKAMKKQLEMLTEHAEKGTIDLFYAIFFRWQIVRRNFCSNDMNLLYIERSRLQNVLLKRMQQFLNVDLPYIEVSKRNRNRILVITDQLLGLKHGPTRNTLDYCYTLSKKMQKEVFLLVITELPTKANYHEEYEVQGINYCTFNYVEKYEGNFYYEYLGEEISGYQCKVTNNNKEELINVLQYIHNWNPFLVYNMGSENLVADLLSTFTTEVSLAFSYQFPISEAQYLILARNIENQDKAIEDYILQKNQKILESKFVYKLEEPIKKFKKSDYEISEEMFVIAIVGTRLSEEIDDTVIKLLHNILELESTVYVVFLGYLENFEEIREKIGFTDRLKYLGFQKDVRGILQIADIYLNPPRKGGGTSAVEAMAEGVPVVTLPGCDVAYAAGINFVSNNLYDFIPTIVKYISDRQFYDNQSNNAKIQANQLVNTEEVLNDIINRITESL